jgi:hypothetical protein
MPPKILKLAEIIRDYEGKPGDRNYRNNNPGNCRYNFGGYLSKYGKVRRDKDGFAIFPTYEQGWMYLCNMLKHWAQNTRAEWTILALMESYAPAADNNDPKRYAEYISQHLGVPASTKLRDLLDLT